MDFGSTSEILVFTAKWVGIASLMLVFLLSCSLFVLRRYFTKEDQRAEAVREVWQEVFTSCFDGEPIDIPKVEQEDMVTIIVLWNYFHEIFKDAAKERLNEVAKTIGADEWSLKALKQGTIRQRLLAIQTLGWMKDDRAWFEILEIMHDDEPVTALCAAKALLRINPPFGIEYFMPLVAERTDFNVATVGKLLREAGAEVVTEPMIEEIGMREGDELCRILRFVRLAYEERSAPVLKDILVRSEDVSEIVTCLRAFDSAEHLEIVREHLKHEDWRVRTQAAICLGRLGTEEDIARLIHASGDQHWWVRFRAARALAQLPSVTNRMLKKFADEHQNFFGSDIINKVRVEREVYQ